MEHTRYHSASQPSCDNCLTRLRSQTVNKNVPVLQQGRKNLRGTTLFQNSLAAIHSLGLKSPGDVTVAPVVPTAIFNTLLTE